MSSEPETNNPAAPSASRESLDLTGLPAPVADELKKLVVALRDNLGSAAGSPSSATSTTALQANPGEWVRRLQAWVDSLPVRPTSMDDSRESIYAGRGE